MLQLPEHGWAAPATEVCQHRHHHPLLLGQPCRQGGVESLNNYLTVFLRTVVPHSFFADPDPYVFSMRIWIQADPDPALKTLLKLQLPYEEFAVVEKTKKDILKVKKNHGVGPS